MRHSICKILFVLGANEYLERLEVEIRKCLFFDVKILWNNSVSSSSSTEPRAVLLSVSKLAYASSRLSCCLTFNFNFSCFWGFLTHLLIFLNILVQVQSNWIKSHQVGSNWFRLEYRVSHIEVCKVNQLWEIEGPIFFKNYCV